MPNKYNAEETRELIYDIYSAKDLSSAELTKKTSDALKYIVNTPYSDVMKNMTGNVTNPAYLANDLLAALYDYYTRKYNTTFKNKKFEQIDKKNETDFIIYRAFTGMSTHLNIEGFCPYGLSTKGKFRLFKEYYISNLQKNDKENQKIVIDRYLNNGLSVNEIEKNVLTECSAILSNGDRLLRGSSDEYKEIQSEIKTLFSYIDKVSKKPDAEGDKAVEQHYIYTMIGVLAEKADNYVSKRADTEIEHSLNGYKGQRIFRMRRLANRLRLLENMQKTNLLPMNKDQAVKFNYLLQRKFGKMTFSKRMLAEIKSLNRCDSKITDEEIKKSDKKSFINDPYSGETNKKIYINDYTGNVETYNNSFEMNALDNLHRNSTVTYHDIFKEHNAAFRVIKNEYKEKINGKTKDGLLAEYSDLRKDPAKDIVTEMKREYVRKVALNHNISLPMDKDIYERFGEENAREEVYSYKDDLRWYKNTAKFVEEEKNMSIPITK